MSERGVVHYRLIGRTDFGDTLLIDIPVREDALDHEDRADVEAIIRSEANWAMQQEVEKHGDPRIVSREWWRGGFQDDDFIRDRMPVRLTGKEWR